MKVFRIAALSVSFAVCPLLALDEGLLQYSAPDATEFAGMRVQRLAAWPPATEFIQKAGAGDIQEVLAMGKNGAGGVVAVRGTFNRALLGKLTETYNGVELYAAPAQAVGHVVAFPESTVAVLGDVASVKAALDRRGTIPALDPVLSAKAREVDGRYDAWFAAKGRAGVRVGKAKLPDDALQLVSGGITLGNVVQVTAEALMKSETEAQSIVQLVKFLAAMGAGQKQMPPFLQTLDARVQGSTVVLSISATQAEIEQLFKKPMKVAALQ